MNRRKFLKTSTWLLAAQTAGGSRAAGLAAASVPAGAASSFDFGTLDQDVIPAPDDPADWPAFRSRLARWRQATRERLAYDDALYRRPEFQWAPSAYACCFVMMCDRAFYDPVAGRYTVETFLDEGIRDFGSYDCLVLWHAYPRIGLDERNQFDFYRDVPGGLPSLRRVVHACHRRRVRVFIDYNPWDTGTRREARDDIDSLVDLVGAIQADGIFLDTMSRGAAEFRRKLDAVRRGVVLEGEGALPLDNVHDHHLSWAQWFNDSAVPGVLRNKWFERRHMQHQIKRWNLDHSGELQAAWMNGSGMMVWENVFGSWVGWNARDRSLLRSMLPVQRRYTQLFTGESWTPLVPTEQKQVYASLWMGNGLRLWTLVNRSATPVTGQLLGIELIPGTRCFDLIQGREVKVSDTHGSSVSLAGSIPPRGIAAFVAGSKEALGRDFETFLRRQRALHERAVFETTFPARTVTLEAVTPTRKYSRSEVPPGMAVIPGANLTMTIEFRTRECGFYATPDDLSSVASRLHQPKTFRRAVALGPYAVDLTPVTNAQYARFLKATGYRPRHPENFLKHWKHGVPQAGFEQHPVVYVDLDDARAYARWAGKRLPTEDEWQYAAQGGDGRRYPWGNELEEHRCNTGRTGTTTPVDAFPAGRSPFGVDDLCGNVWQWTESERSDGRTRFCMIRGGSYYQAKGSEWYMDGGTRPCNFSAKFLRTWPGLDRCATVGFRCAVDLFE